MDILFILIGLIGVGGFIYAFTRKDALDIDGDGDVDVDDAIAASERVVEEIVDLTTMTKNELLEYAASEGVDIPKSWNKSKIIARLEV